MIGRVSNLFVGFVDGMPSVNENRNRACRVYVQKFSRKVFVRTRLDQVDMMASVVDIEFGQANSNFLRAKREIVVVELEILIEGQINFLVQPRPHRESFSPSTLPAPGHATEEKKQADRLDHEQDLDPYFVVPNCVVRRSGRSTGIVSGRRLDNFLSRFPRLRSAMEFGSLLIPNRIVSRPIILFNTEGVCFYKLGRCDKAFSHAKFPCCARNR